MNYSSILKQWQEQQQQKLESAIDRVRPWMIKLKHQGIEKIQVTYNGCHDEGCIEEIELEPDNLICLTDEAEDAIEELVFELLPDGWEIEDGSEGKIIFDLVTATISRNHYWLQPTLDETLGDLKLDLEDTKHE